MLLYFFYQEKYNFYTSYNETGANDCVYILIGGRTMKTNKIFGKKQKIEKPIKASTWYSQEKRDLLTLEIEELTDELFRKNQKTIEHYETLARVI